MNLLPVAVPPGHAAFVGAEPLFLPPHRLSDGFPAILTELPTGNIRVAANMGADGADGDAQQAGNFRGRFPLQPHLVYGFDFLFLH